MRTQHGVLDLGVPSRGRNSKAGRFFRAAAALVSTSLLLTGCSLDLGRFGFGGDSSTPETESAEGQASFVNGATQVWTATSDELFEPGGGNYSGSATVHPDMVRAFGKNLVFGDYGHIKSVDPEKQAVTWEQEDVGLLTHCAADYDGGFLYCPTEWGTGDRAQMLIAIDTETGKATDIKFDGVMPLEGESVGHVEPVPGGLIVYRYGDVFRIDLAGKVVWQQTVTTQGSENRYMTVTPTTVMISEPSAGLETLLEVGTGEVIYEGRFEDAPPQALPISYYAPLTDSERFAWDTEGLFDGKEHCLFSVDDVLLFAPDNCEYGSGRGTITALDPQTGNALWDLEIDGTVAQAGNGEYLTTISGLHRVGAHGVYEFDSVTVYGPVSAGEPADSHPIAETTAAQDKGEIALVPVPTGLPSCPGTTITLSWAELANGWVLVCGYSASQPAVWMSQFGGAGDVTSGDVSYSSSGGTESYQAVLPSGSVVRLASDSSDVEVLMNAGDIQDSWGSQVSALPILMIYFVNLGAKQVGGDWSAAEPGESVAPSTSSRTPSATSNAPTTPHPSSDFCPAGSTPYAEGETEGFYISICRSGSGDYTYVGYSPTAGTMVLPAEDLGTRWYASNQSHGYSVSSSYLDVYELDSGKNIIHQPFIWTRQY